MIASFSEGLILCTMFRFLLTALLVSGLFAQDYRWPIRASQSLSATFCEFRDGHLHAGVDIKTWGEMEVPCLAIADGFVESIVVGYNGYGRGLFLRLHDGNRAVYGHLERFTNDMEALVREEQYAREKYYTRLRFEPGEFPIKAGQIIGYSGTSGTEHPHLHFEIRDTSNTVLNPQLFYRGIRDTKRPVFDEILLVPSGPQTRINNSRFPVRIDTDESETPINTTGPFYSLINAHDRANGTYNKYNIYRADLFLNDSLTFAYRFDRLPHDMYDSIDVVYPGVRGKRNWRFMSMFRVGDPDTYPFMPSGKNGLLDPEGVSTLRFRLSDVKRNITSKEFIIRPSLNDSWTIQDNETHYIITRTYPEDGYERFQFYSSKNEHIPVAQTYYRLTSTSWMIMKSQAQNGIRALGTRGVGLKWVIPPSEIGTPTLDHSWASFDSGYILKLHSDSTYTFPLSYQIRSEEGTFKGELVQVMDDAAESDIIPLEFRALGAELQLLVGRQIIHSHQLTPLRELLPGDSLSIHIEDVRAELKARNEGDTRLFLSMDTTRAKFAREEILGAQVHSLGEDVSGLTGTISFKHELTSSGSSLFTPGKKKRWKRLNSLDTLGYSHLPLSKNGRYFLLSDLDAPHIKPVKNIKNVRRGDRLVFKLSENTELINYRESLPTAQLDEERFYPDYNPLRKELSFHVPKDLVTGQHEFSLTLTDYSQNRRDYTYRFTVVR